MKNANKPISPCLMQQVGDNEYRAAKKFDPVEYTVPMEGLTKREYFAGLASQGFITAAFGSAESAARLDLVLNGQDVTSGIAEMAVAMADALLKELEV
jgi:hypothetical protein